MGKFNFKSKICLLIFVSFLVSPILLLGCNGVDTKKEWIGTVKVHMRLVPGDSGVHNATYDLSFITVNKEKFYLLTSNDVVVKGLQRTKDSITWEFNKTYRIKGEIVENNEYLEYVKDRGYSNIIMASYIEIIRDDNIETFNKNMVPKVKSTL